MISRIFYIPETGVEKPVVQIMGDRKFIGFFLGQFLTQQNCQVIFEPSPSQKIDYLFYLSKNGNQDLKEIFDLAQKNNAKLLLAFSTRVSQNSDYLFQLGHTLKVNFRIVFLEKVFGPKMDPQDFRQLVSAGVYEKNDYVFISDLVYGLSKAMFTHGTNEKTFYLLSEKKQEVLARKEERLIGWQPIVSFEEGLEKTKDFFSSSPPPLLKENFSEKEKEKEEESFLKKISLAEKTSPTVNEVSDLPVREKPEEKIEENEEKKTKKRFLNQIPFLFVFLIFLGLITLPITSIGGSLFLGKVFLDRSKNNLLVGKFLPAQREADLAKKSFTYSKSSLNFFRPLINFFPQRDLIKRGEKLIDLGITSSQSLSSGSLLGDSGWQIFKNFFLTERTLTPLEVADLINQSQFLVTDTGRHLSLTQALVKETRFEEEMSMLPPTIEALEKVDLFWPVLSKLLALEERKTYLVLLQNNAELRPTGGFIGSFALVTLNQGELIDFDVQDVYWADGQLKGHVEPPGALKDYLGEGGWYLRDSNWDPDFPTSAQRAIWFLEKETGRKVDGVIALNLNVVKDVLSQMGEINLPDFREKITAQNLFEKAEYYSEVNFFPGSTQKQDFLGELVFVLFEELKKANPDLLAKTALSLFESARQKNLLFYFNDSQLEKKFLGLNWGGQIRKPICDSNEEIKCITDYLMIVEANVGVNKANYFVKRNLFHQVSLDRADKPQMTTRLVYSNESLSEKFPAGVYRNYLRLLLPLQVEVEEVRIKNEQEKLLKTLEKEDLNLIVNHDLLSVGFLVEVPIQSSRIVEIDYRLPIKLSRGVNRYVLLIQKQSGIEDESFKFSFTSNSSLEIEETSPPIDLTRGSRVVFDPTFDQDLFFSILLKR